VHKGQVNYSTNERTVHKGQVNYSTNERLAGKIWHLPISSRPGRLPGAHGVVEIGPQNEAVRKESGYGKGRDFNN
jgi:hypothetical protein